MNDRFGLSLRPEFEVDLLHRLSEVDVVELLAEPLLKKSPLALSFAKTLSRYKPVLLHGVSLGLATCSGIDRARIDAWARLLDTVQPEAWTEHLALVRTSSHTLGHLAAPLRTRATLDGLHRNLKCVVRTVGAVPWLENVASLVTPPFSDQAEWPFIDHALAAAETPLLLDLHNLYTNARNSNESPENALRQVPWHRVKAIHVAGGRELPNGLWLDDHLHDVPPPVWTLLREAASLHVAPMTVIIERDGNFTSSELMFDALKRARLEVAQGRASARADSSKDAA